MALSDSLYKPLSSISENGPSSFDSGGGPIGKDTTNTSAYRQFSVGKSSANYIYLRFDLSSIPANAKINSVSARLRVRSASTFTHCNADLRTGSTVKAGGAYLSATSSTVYTLSGGAWTRDELNDLNIEIYLLSSSSSSSNRIFYLYGADVTVAYTYENQRFLVKLNDGVFLPNGHTRLNYIKTEGAQHINTGFIANQNTRVDITYRSDSTSGNLTLIGADANWGNSGFGIWAHAAEFGSATTSLPAVTTKRTITNDKGVIQFDGVTHTTLSSDAFTTPCPLTICALNRNSTAIEYITTAEIYAVKIYDNGTLVRNYYPCLNPSNVPGLYDIVNGVFYSSATSTPFVAGPEYNAVWHDIARTFKKVSGIWVEQTDLANVVDQTKRLVNGGEYVVELPEGYTRLEYIESTGEEYIDLGVSIGPSNAANIKSIVNKKIKNLGAYALDGTGFGSAPYNNSFYVGIDASGNIAYGNGRTDETTTQAYDGTWKTFTYSGEGKITITGMSDISFTFQVPDTALNFFLFAYNQGTNGIKKYSGRISDAQIIENGTVIRNVIACRQDATGIVGMYDVKNGVFYHSASGVELKAPGEVPPTFTVYGITYQFEDGMTWAEWLASDYKTSANIMAASGYVVVVGASQYNVLDSSGNKVPTTALIIEDEAYTI